MEFLTSHNKNNEERQEYMTTAPVGPLIVSLALPAVASIMTTAFYNAADAYFVSQIGTSASGAVGIVFAMMAILQAIGFTLGMGAGSVISRALGAGDVQKASRYASTSFFSALTLGAAVCLFGHISIDGLMRLLGSTPTILPYAKSYAVWILYGAPVICGAFTMNIILRSEGHAAFGMRGLVCGGFLNVALDPIFIFKFGLGISGAAMATLISQCVSFSILLSFFLRRKSDVEINIRKVSLHPKTFFDIVSLGFASFTRQGLASASAAALNLAASAYGDAAVAAMSLVGRVFFLIQAVVIGTGHGFTPVAGYAYGAGDFRRVRSAFWFTVKGEALLMALLAAASYALAPDIIALFRRGDADVIAIGTRAMRFQSLSLLLAPILVTSGMIHQSLGFAWRATLLSCTRNGICFIPLIIVLPRFIGLTGVEVTQTAADFLSFIITVPFLYFFMKMLRAKEKGAKIK